MNFKSYTMDLAGRPLTIEFGKYAEQASGSAFVRYGDTIVLVSATMSKEPRAGIDFFPLSVDFEEKQYSVGRIPGGFLRREGRPTEHATLTSRLIDRPLRPLFPEGMRNDVQVVATVLSVDTELPPEIPAMIGSSVALSVSEIPFNGPTGSVVVGRVDGKFVICPAEEERKSSDLHLTVSGTKEAILMVEASANEISEEVMLEGIMLAHEEIKKIIAFQEKIVEEIGKTKVEVPLALVSDEVMEAVREFAYEKCSYAFETFDRKERSKREKETKNETLEHFKEIYLDQEWEVVEALNKLNQEVMRERILKQSIRPDGRKHEEIRPIWCEVGLLPRTHGSAIFTRGQTQTLTVTTLGTLRDAQMLDGLSNEEEKRYMHHYNMPPYATGEAGRMRSAGRREIGHGALAERALEPVLPDEKDFPYALRLVSEVLSSNGSSSMASVCGSTLSLMDAGVPIMAPVAGVAMGLIKDSDSADIAILTDIQGIEDFLGDMDFKVAGTMNGITAIQMDIKISGIDKEILERALAQALTGRLYILSEMLKTLSQPREEMSPYAPKIIKFYINPEKIREVIGPGGKMINKIIEDTGVKIDLEDDGSVYIASTDVKSAEEARKIIENIAKDIEVGDVYLGTVVRIMNFGAFVELVPGKDGMIHISKLANKHVEKVEDVVNVGDKLEVKVQEIDGQGRVNLIRNDMVYEERPFRKPGNFRNRPPRRDNRN